MSGKRVIRAAARVVCGLGLLVVFATAGASDAGDLTIRQIVTRGLVGLVMFAGGGYFGGLME